MMLPELCIHSPNDGGENKPLYKLERYLYAGASHHDSRWVWRKIERGELGEPQTDRCELLLAIKEEMEFRLVSGQSARSIQTYLSTFKEFIKYLEEQQLSFRLEQLVENYIAYSEYLFMHVHKKPAKLKRESACDMCSRLSNIFGSILNIPQSERLIGRIRLKRKVTAKRAVGKTAEKQNLENTFKMGRFLVDLIAGLSKESILGGLPLAIPMREGLVQNNEVLLYAGLKEKEWLSKSRNEWTSKQNKQAYKLERVRKPVDSVEGTTRWALINLRVCAEFLLFVGQTGMNLTPAKGLERGTFKYKSLGDSWEVKCYKNRRGGEVSFKIYKSYKPFLERYRSFINYYFPDSKYLFPLIDSRGEESNSRLGLNGNNIRLLLQSYDVPWVPPSTIRCTRVNWLLRRSGDEELTADLAQHTQKVLRDKYELPSQQRAMVEITRFWNKHDPIKKGKLRGSVVGGPCNGKPEAIDSKPDAVVGPNCTNPSGCLWCKHHRDSDNEDYVWSLMSMRYLKTIEAGVTLTTEGVPADHVVDRLTKKIEWYRQSNINRSKWVSETELRMGEGHYHPHWSPIIEFLES